MKLCVTGPAAFSPYGGIISVGTLLFFFSFSHEKLRSKTIMLRYSHTLQLTHKKRKKHMERERGGGAGEGENVVAFYILKACP